ncbi:MAG: DUF3857 domain-containing protein, partial [Phaeodactylibacter sp.]|nr:DUF3857 domain-containing protein [Phaeodactylibacter sp.]
MTRIDGYPQPAFLALLLSILSLSVYAQKPPMKWGNVDKSDLSMFTYQADTAATAVILCDYAELSVDLGDGDLRYVFEHHRRIKILKRTGFDYADVTIPFYEGQEVSNLKAQLFTPDGQEYEVNKNDIFEEQSSESWSQMKFTFPQVVEGAVIEYRYRLSSTNVLQLREWYFQHEIPTRWSELRLSIPEWYDYIFLNQGRMADISEQGHQMESIRIPAGRSADSRGGGTIQAKVNKYRLAMENVPGLKEEAYVTTMDDYLARIRFQLRSIRYSSSHLDQILSDWPTLAKELNESDYLGRQITKKKNQKALLEALEPIWAEGGAESKEEKALLAYQFLNNTIEWDGHYSIFSDQDLTDCLEKKKAGSGELNLMMLCVLHTLEIEAYPVLLSTREHGKMLELYPILSQFNHLIAMANLNGQMQLLDLGSPARPPGYPRVSALNGSGWIASETNPQWIQFSPPGAKATSMYTMDKDPRSASRMAPCSAASASTACRWPASITSSPPGRCSPPRRRPSCSGTSTAISPGPQKARQAGNVSPMPVPSAASTTARKGRRGSCCGRSMLIRHATGWSPRPRAEPSISYSTASPTSRSCVPPSRSRTLPARSCACAGPSLM